MHERPEEYEAHFEISGDNPEITIEPICGDLRSGKVSGISKKSKIWYILLDYNKKLVCRSLFDCQTRNTPGDHRGESPVHQDDGVSRRETETDPAEAGDGTAS